MEIPPIACERVHAVAFLSWRSRPLSISIKRLLRQKKSQKTGEIISCYTTARKIARCPLKARQLYDSHFRASNRAAPLKPLAEAKLKAQEANFRASNRAAPLKPAVCSNGLLDSGDFRASNRAAPLKHPGSHDVGADDLYFRASNRAAPLKPWADYRPWVPAAHFRASNRAAPLKRAPLLPFLLHRARFPREQSRGPIEARVCFCLT